MLCFVLATSVFLVDAREINFLSANDSTSFEDITVSSNDPWLPLVGDTEGVQSMTTVKYEPRAKESRRRAHNLVESLRKKLMRDNYDYMYKDSAENVTTTTVTTPTTTVKSPTTTVTSPTTTLMSTTTATKTTNKSLTSTVAIVEKPSIVASYYNQMLATKVVKEFALMRAQPRVASVNLPKFPFRDHLFSGVHPPRPTSARDPPDASHLAALHPSADPVVHRFRSFDEAFNTPSPRVNEMGHGTEPKLPVFKKDLFYYVNDDRLKPGLHLRRNNDVSKEHNEYGGSENILEQYEEIDKPTTHNIRRENHHIRRQDRILGRQRRRHNYKHKHRQTEKERNLKGISKRFKQYGLRPKKRPHRMYYNRRTGENGTQQNSAVDERMEYEQNNQSDDLYNSLRDNETDNRHSNQYGNQQNEQRNDNFNNRHSGHLDTQQNGQQVDAVDNLSINFNGHHEELQEKKHHDDKKDIQYDDQENTQRVETHNKNHIVNKTDVYNRETEIKQEMLAELQDKPFDDMKDQPFDKDENIVPEHTVQHDEGQQEDINDGQSSNNMQHYSQYVEETTSNVKYKLLKVQSLGSRARRSGIEAPQHILQERGSRGVALISLNQAPFPQFRLPRARRQYMHETDNIRHPLVEQLPKATAIARRSYDGRRRAT